MMWGYGGWGLGGILMTVSTLLFLGLIAYVVIRYADPGDRGRGDRAGTTGPTAEQLLANRFAAGEIDEQDFRHRLQILREHTGQLSRR